MRKFIEELRRDLISPCASSSCVLKYPKDRGIPDGACTCTASLLESPLKGQFQAKLRKYLYAVELPMDGSSLDALKEDMRIVQKHCTNSGCALAYTNENHQHTNGACHCLDVFLSPPLKGRFRIMLAVHMRRHTNV